MVNFLIVVTGCNCKRYVQKCLKSIENQTYTNYRAIVVNDASKDSTLRIIQRFDFEIITNEINMGAAYSRYIAIHRKAYSEDVVLLLGLDDELLPDCLETIAKEYEKGKEKDLLGKQSSEKEEA